MRASDTTILESPPQSPPAPGKTDSCIDLDRFCEGCGYNLRTQMVTRDLTTGIPVVRCPECGKFQAANELSSSLRPWLRRVTAMLVGIWILTILATIFWLGVAEGALSYATLDELTTYGQYTTQRIDNTTVRTWQGGGTIRIDTGYEQYGLFLASVLFCSILTAFVCTAFCAVVCPHWPRIACLVLALAFPIIAGGVVAVGWSQEAPHLLEWGLTYIGAHGGMQILGGMLGIALGRPMARLAVRIFLPSGLRPRLAYLWLADDKPLPTPSVPANRQRQ